jgi:hypothetical protein
MFRTTFKQPLAMRMQVAMISFVREIAFLHDRASNVSAPMNTSTSLRANSRDSPPHGVLLDNSIDIYLDDPHRGRDPPRPNSSGRCCRFLLRLNLALLEIINKALNKTVD